jgi:hypothetical protein
MFPTLSSKIATSSSRRPAAAFIFPINPYMRRPSNGSFVGSTPGPSLPLLGREPGTRELTITRTENVLVYRIMLGAIEVIAVWQHRSASRSKRRDRELRPDTCFSIM